MSHNQPSISITSSSNSLDYELETLKQENTRLKSQMRAFQGEHINTKAFLEQRIGFLENQLTNHQEREENIKKTNETIMKALGDLDSDHAKDALKIKAIEELEKANDQYKQSLDELKTRMKGEIEKLENQNKELQESAMMKDMKLQVLNDFIKDMKTDYTGVKVGKITNSNSSPQKSSREWEERSFLRSSTSPAYSAEYERENNLEFQREKRGSKHGERSDLLTIQEENNFLATDSTRSEVQPSFYEKDNVHTSRSLAKGLLYPNENSSFGFLSSNPLSPRDGEIVRRLESYTPKTDIRESLTKSSNGLRLQMPNQAFNEYALTPKQQNYENNKESLTPKTSKVGKDLIIKNFNQISKNLADIPSSSSRATDGFLSVRENLNKRYGQEYGSPVNRNVTPKRELLLGSYENPHSVLLEKKSSNRNSDAKTGREIGYDLRSSKQKAVRESKTKEAPTSGRSPVQNEVKYMVGRLLKVKDKLDKKGGQTHR